uniref:Uncharacterized protein n=1 Tax=Steinernema glaseri TaxID=37863 RepID=A0A1I7ZYB3_9BILA
MIPCDASLLAVEAMPKKKNSIAYHPTTCNLPALWRIAFGTGQMIPRDASLLAMPEAVKLCQRRRNASLIIQQCSI